MGHDTENLVGEVDLEEFKGIILSPLNRLPDELESNIHLFRTKDDYDIVFDSQLYFPRSRREKLYEHPYFPKDLDTADISSLYWWKKLNSKLSDYSRKLGVDAVTSPVVLPKSWSLDYYSLCSEVSDDLYNKLEGNNIRLLTTVLVNINSLADEEEVYKFASVLAEAPSSGFYIVIDNSLEPRREFSDSENLLGAMTLIHELKNTGIDVFVSYCSSDMLLFKSAGADNCATCKFFNLRRFTKSRWEEPSAGGGQLPYWFEHSLLGFLREADVLRLIEEDYSSFLMHNNSNNHWSNEILSQFKNEPGKAWLALSWRQYLSWFGKTEFYLTKNTPIPIVQDWLKDAEKRWIQLDDNNVLFDEPRNDGNWIRPWRQALNKFSKKHNL